MFKTIVTLFTAAQAVKVQSTQKTYEFGECNDADGNPRWEGTTPREECPGGMSFRQWRVCATQFTTWYNACEAEAEGEGDSDDNMTETAGGVAWTVDTDLAQLEAE